MSWNEPLKHDRNYRPIPCSYCTGEHKTMFQAFASDEVLAGNEVECIDDLTDEDIRREASGYSPACWIEGDCLPCNGPDDGDCGDGEVFRD